MKVIHSFDDKQDNPIALTIGNFDGVHLGHQKIIQQLQQVAKEKQLETAVMTFSPHPSLFFRPQINFLINNDEQKLELLEKQGVNTVFLVKFNQDFASQPPEQFIDCLIKQLNVRYLLVGDDFRFGYQGRGDYELLAGLAENKFESARVPTQLYDTDRISSSRIRELLKVAEFDKVSALLDRYFYFSGKVEHGQKLGRKLGFPTANLAISELMLLPAGVFVVKASTQNKDYFGVCNIGYKPTVSDNKRSVEVHLFEFSAQIYGMELTVTPLAKLRDEIKFSSVEVLTAQINQDIQAAKMMIEEKFR